MRSLRRQLTVGMLFAFALLLGGGGLWVHWATRSSLTSQFDAALRVKALVVTGNTLPKGDSIRVYFSDRFLQEFDEEVATDFFQVFDLQGRTVARSDSLAQGDLPVRHGTVQEPVYWDMQLPNGKPARAIGIRLQLRTGSGRKPAGGPLEATIVVASDRSELDGTLKELRQVLVGSGVGLAILMVLVIPAVTRRALRPLNQLAERTARIDARSLGDRFSVERLPAELQPIAGRLNDLLARLESSFERERRFSADLAHELRTPLAELRLQSEMALKWPAERTASVDTATLEVVLQMEGLVTRLLELSRAEQGTLKLDTKRIELAPLVEAVITSYDAEATARALTVIQNLQPGLSANADPVLLRSIVSNLIGNAVHYSTPQGRVEVTLLREGDRFRLQMANPAPHLVADDLSRMFDRFWRKDTARTGEGHSGLGLALSRSLAALLGLTVEPTLRSDGVLVMAVTGRVEAGREDG